MQCSWAGVTLRRPSPLLPCRDKLLCDLEEVTSATADEAATKSDDFQMGRASLEKESKNKVSNWHS